MGFLDRLVGGGRAKEGRKEEAAADSVGGPSSSSPSPSGPSELQHDASASYGPPQLDMPTIAQGVPGMTGMPDMGAGPSGRLYDPYQGISAAVVGRKHAFKLPTQPEFVFEEEASVKRRGWSENLQFYTGVGYLSGGIAGVSHGAYKYLTVKPDVPLDSLKLQANRILNLAGSKAKPFSNNTAILGLFFASWESYLASTIDDPSIPDAVSTVLAGGMSGALFRSPRGPRAAAAAGAVGMVAGGCIAAARTVFPSL